MSTLLLSGAVTVTDCVHELKSGEDVGFSMSDMLRSGCGMVS